MKSSHTPEGLLLSTAGMGETNVDQVSACCSGAFESISSTSQEREGTRANHCRMSHPSEAKDFASSAPWHARRQCKHDNRRYNRLTVTRFGWRSS